MDEVVRKLATWKQMTDRKTDWSIGHRGKNSIQSELRLDCPTRDRSNRPIENSILSDSKRSSGHTKSASIAQSSIWDSLPSDRIRRLGLQSPSIKNEVEAFAELDENLISNLGLIIIHANIHPF